MKRRKFVKDEGRKREIDKEKKEKEVNMDGEKHCTAKK